MGDLSAAQLSWCAFYIPAHGNGFIYRTCAAELDWTRRDVCREPTRIRLGRNQQRRAVVRIRGLLTEFYN